MTWPNRVWTTAPKANSFKEVIKKIKLKSDCSQAAKNPSADNLTKISEEGFFLMIFG